MNSATSALHTVLLGLNVNENSIVWVPGISFVATANCVEYCGAKLEFLDVDHQTGNVCLESLKIKLRQAQKTQSSPDVIIIVDIAGRPCELSEIISLSEEFKFKIVHDASHSFGSNYNFRKLVALIKLRQRCLVFTQSSQLLREKVGPFVRTILNWINRSS